MRTRKPKRHKAWLITWEAFPEHLLKDVKRPRVVAILKQKISDGTIEKILPVLFSSESRLTFTEKIGSSFFPHPPEWLHKDIQGRISCGKNPRLWARRVKDLYVQSHDDAWDHQTLHWTELPVCEVDAERSHIIEVSPEQHSSEDVFFEKLWNEPADLLADAVPNK